jgi:LDH2 family malate/lactate/ureidoglycolate dehydrogenase
MATRLHEAPRAPGVERIRIPDERGAALEAERLQMGLVYRRADLAGLFEAGLEEGISLSV